MINNVVKARTAIVLTDIQNCFSKAINNHSKENAPERKLIDSKKITSFELAKSGTENTKAHIKPKDHVVVAS